METHAWQLWGCWPQPLGINLVELNWQTFHYLVSNPNKTQYPHVDSSFSTQNIHITPCLAGSSYLQKKKKQEVSGTGKDLQPQVPRKQCTSTVESVHKHWEDGELNLEKGVSMIRDSPTTTTTEHLHSFCVTNPWQLGPGKGQSKPCPFGMWKEKCKGNGREGTDTDAITLWKPLTLPPFLKPQDVQEGLKLGVISHSRQLL